MSQSKLAWITGGASGIGLACAHSLGKLGYRVALSSRSSEKVSAAVAELQAAGIEAIALPADVGDETSVSEAASQLIDRHGEVDVLLACAGTNVPNRYWRNMTAGDFAKVTATNLNGVAGPVCSVLPGMRKAGGGTVIVISSWAGWRFTAFTGAAYGASKHGLAPLVESLNEQEGQHGIRATVICPGEVATPILRSRPSPPPESDVAQMLVPEDIAQAVAYIVSAPARVCFNEIVISPTVNRIYSGADDLAGSQG